MSKPPGFSRLLMLLGAISLLTPFSLFAGLAGCASCGSAHSLTVWRTVQALGAGSASVWLLTALGIGCAGLAYVMLRESIPAQRSAVTGSVGA